MTKLPLLTAATLLPVLSLCQESASAPALSKELRAALEEIEPEGIEAHVRFLASDELLGRHARSEEARRAAEYVRDRFRELGLEALTGEEYLLPVEDEELSPNVVACLPGKGDGFVLVGAHYDHLAPREAKDGDDADRIFNGADDNASGTAALLEIAQAFKALPERPTCTVVFAAFTAEEMGLIGSRHLVANPPFPLDELRAMINLDMISRGEENLVFCEGGKTAPELKALSERMAPLVELEVRYDLHPDWLSASDHDPFMKASIPTLYFGVEDHEDYHKVGDEADKILPVLASRVARLAFLISAEVAGSE